MSDPKKIEGKKITNRAQLFLTLFFGLLGLSLLIGGLLLEWSDRIWPGVGSMIAIVSAFPLIIFLLLLLSYFFPRIS